MQRFEFVQFALQPGANRRELCRRFALSPSTAYKWLERFQTQGVEGLSDRSRRPHHSPGQTDPRLAERLLQLQERFPCWGPRKLRQLLRTSDPAAALPAPSTVAAILKRYGRRVLSDASAQPPYQRFVHSQPNELWQMDFKGPFPLSRSRGSCYPLTLLDDHSRFALALHACSAQHGGTVQPVLVQAFQRYGLPERILCDNAGPWGSSEPRTRFTRLEVWLLRLGVELTHGRPHHPQTQGKCERFHRTLQLELLQRSTAWPTLAHCQSRFDQWRHTYNHLRPHQALELAPPASRYRPSTRPMPAQLPPIQYLAGDQICRVKSKGEITFRNHCFFVGQALAGLPVALRPTTQDALFALFFCWKQLGYLNLRSACKAKFRYNALQPLSQSPQNVSTMSPNTCPP